MEYRRFELVDKDKEEALLSLIERKGLTDEDLMLILDAIKKRSNSVNANNNGTAG